MDEKINDKMIERIITSQNKNSSIRILKWQMDDNVAKSCPKYSSTVSRLIIYYEKDGVKNRKILFAKVPSITPTYEFMKIGNMYERENIMYTNILPEMLTIDEEYFSPKFYFLNEDDSIFLEDLAQSGYKSVNCSEQLDFEHCYYLFKKMAKFHALSLKLNGDDCFTELLKIDAVGGGDNPFVPIAIREFINHLPKHLLEMYPEEVTALKDGKWSNLFGSSIRQGAFKVLNHGDLSANNIMFKYDKYGNVVDLKLLDFQLAFWSSPATDLVYFTISSMKFEVYEKYFPLLLEIYLDTLNRTLVSVNCPMYRMQNLLQDVDWEFAQAHSTICFRLAYVFSDPDDPVDAAGLVKDGQWDISPLFKVFKRQIYMDHATKWIVHLLGRKKLNGICL